MMNIEIVYIIIPLILVFTYLVCDFFQRKKLYEDGQYYKITKIPFISIGRDPGFYGEYLIYKTLKHFELEKARFLFNLYIPTYSGKTTEIDVVMISQCGIFVFESKNYGGWIFGSENQKKWTQSLYSKYGAQKETFYNPIMQNQYHIDYLKKLIGKNVKTHSIIVFSDDCKLKSIKRIPNSKAHLIYKSELKYTVDCICNESVNYLTLKGVDDIYNILYKYSQASEFVKSKHVLNLKTYR